MATLHLLLRETHPRKDGTYPIAFRIHDGKVIWKNTGYHVAKNQWKGGVVVKHRDAAIINAAVEQQRQDWMRKLAGSEPLTGRGPTFQKAIDRLLEHYEATSKIAAYNRMLTNRRILLEVWGTLDKPLAKVSKEDVDRYMEYRFKTGNTKSTIRKNLQDLSVVYTFAEHPGGNPFRKATATIKPDPVKRSKLSAEDITRLENAPLTGLYAVARDMFLFAYYAHGMRFGTLATLTREMVRGSHLTYRMDKGRKIREVEIHAKLRAIIARYQDGGTPYLFPGVTELEITPQNRKQAIGPTNANMNKYIKGAAIQAGVEVPVSMHVARHTFAYRALQSEIPAAVIKDALGQSNFATFQGYIKSLSDDQINNSVRKLYE